MKFNRLFFGAVFVAVASAALAGGGTTTVQAAGGSVSGINTTNGAGSWNGLQQTAYNATMNYGSPSTSGTSDFKLRAGDPSSQTGQQGTPVNNNGFSNVQTSAAGTTSTSGKGTVSTGSNPAAPTYYDATWSTTSSASTTGVAFGSGTYDPWAVYARDVLALGTAKNQTADLYYQATLFGGRGSLTSFNLDPGQLGSYSFTVGNTDINGESLVDIDVFSDNRFTADVNLQEDFEVFLLDPINAGDPNLTPYQRISTQFGATALVDTPGGTTASQKLTNVLSGLRLQNGSFNRNLDFGILYHFTLTTDNPDQTVFEWTTNNTQATPEPAPMAALGLGAIALLRRRRKQA